MPCNPQNDNSSSFRWLCWISRRKKQPNSNGKGILPRQDSHIFDNVGPNGKRVLTGTIEMSLLIISTEAKKMIESYHRRPYSVSPVVDIAARLLVAIIGGLLVLVPMTTLCYVTEIRWVLIVTFCLQFPFQLLFRLSRVHLTIKSLWRLRHMALFWWCSWLIFCQNQQIKGIEASWKYKTLTAS